MGRMVSFRELEIGETFTEPGKRDVLKKINEDSAVYDNTSTCSTLNFSAGEMVYVTKD